MAGPCVLESADLIAEVVETVQAICAKLAIPYIFKTSYKKANRTSIHSFTGIGDEKALALMADLREKYQVPILTDVHSVEEAKMAAEVVDVLQIPAFLCRQTDLLMAAAETGKFVNIKKGQFLSPQAMQHAAQKVADSGNDKVWLTERGTTFGYNDLVVDFRGIPTMQAFGFPVVLDCTHSLQQPNQGAVTGGQPKMIGTIAKAGIAVGVDGLFIETHPKPEVAKSDGANMLPLAQLESLLEQLVAIKACLKTN
ncbi:MAG: 3-deoxy-8-phosphooctulonate synthase [Chitinophagales bacterium]